MIFLRKRKNSGFKTAAVGLYCNLVFSVIASEETAYNVNSMFLIHSPFEGMPFATCPTIAGAALVMYFIIFAVCKLIFCKKGRKT